jgi:hypothetical protein
MITVMKSRNITTVGHVPCTTHRRNSYRILDTKSEVKKKLGDICADKSVILKSIFKNMT